jgi:transmembrane sensor
MTRHQSGTGGMNVPRELDAALRERGDGAALRAVYQAVASDASADAKATVAATEREAAWARLSRRLNDPDRVPYTDEVPPMLELVTDEVESAATAAVMAGPESSASSVLAAAAAATTQPPRARRVFTGLRGLAAAAVLLLGIGIGWASGQQHYHNAPGSRTVLQPLGDGSQVWLAPGSTVSQSRRWALYGWTGLDWLKPDARRVTLAGEAFFAVVRDPRPFTVETGDAEVRVLGTRFAVRAASAVHGTRVQVEEGRVAVTQTVSGGVPGTSSRAELTAGDAAQVVGAALSVYRVPAGRVAVAAQGGMTAIDEPLGEVFDALSRRYGVVIERSARVNLANKVSFFFPDEPDVETVLGDLCAAQGLTYTRTSRGYRIDGP